MTADSIELTVDPSGFAHYVERVAASDVELARSLVHAAWSDDFDVEVSDVVARAFGSSLVMAFRQLPDHDGYESAGIALVWRAGMPMELAFSTHMVVMPELPDPWHLVSGVYDMPLADAIENWAERVESKGRLA